MYFPEFTQIKYSEFFGDGTAKWVIFHPKPCVPKACLDDLVSDRKSQRVDTIVCLAKKYGFLGRLPQTKNRLTPY